MRLHGGMERPDLFTRYSVKSAVSPTSAAASLPRFDPQDGTQAIRVFLQDGSNDLNNAFGNWPLPTSQWLGVGIRQVRLQFEFAPATTAASTAALFSLILRWLWREEK